MASMNPSTTPDAGDLNYNDRLSTCPRCAEPTVEGFAHADMSFVPREKILNWFIFPESLPPWRIFSIKYWCPSKYFRSHLCRACGCIIVDSSMILTVADARRLAAEREETTEWRAIPNERCGR